jgi:hypothetical protein
LSLIKTGNRLFADDDGAGVRFLQTIQAADQRRLSRSAEANNAKDISLFNM